MRHYFNRKVRLLLLAAVLLAVVLALGEGVLGSSPGTKLVSGVLAPIRTAANRLANQAEQFYSYMFRYEALEAENAILKEQLAQMQDDARLAASVSRENDRLRELAGLTSAHEDYKPVDAYIIAWSSNDWSRSFTIGRGTSSGITEGMCAITENGEVVGLVTEAGVNYAVVKTILDSSLEISATLASSGYSGMVKGAYTSGEKDLLRMNYISSDAVLRNNDQVVTAGSTVYPRNLIIGSVIDAGFEDTGVAKYAVLQPAADIESLEQVFIVTEFSAE